VAAAVIEEEAVSEAASDDNNAGGSETDVDARFVEEVGGNAVPFSRRQFIDARGASRY
jgi:hypothetical protein